MKNARIKKRSSLAGEVSFRSSLTPEAKDAQLEGDYSHAKVSNALTLASCEPNTTCDFLELCGSVL